MQHQHSATSQTKNDENIDGLTAIDGNGATRVQIIRTGQVTVPSLFFPGQEPQNSILSVKDGLGNELCVIGA